MPNLEKIYVSVSAKYNLPPLTFPIEISMTDTCLRDLGFTLIQAARVCQHKCHSASYWSSFGLNPPSVRIIGIYHYAQHGEPFNKWAKVPPSQKKKRYRELAQWLRPLVALTEDLGMVPSIQCQVQMQIKYK